MDIKVSVIVPIYNVEKYISKCLNSLVHQTLREIEVIMVDDGTPDQSARIAETYAEKYEHFHLIHKNNGGLSSARNTGLKAAIGEYVGFVDSDDFVAEDMYEKLYANAKQYDSDFVMSGFYTADADGKETSKSPLSIKQRLIKAENIEKEILLPMLGGMPEDRSDIILDMCVWKNLYRRSCIEENHIRFLSEREYLSEDIVFHMDYLQHTKVASTVQECFYYYRNNGESLTKTFKPDICDRQFHLYGYLMGQLAQVRDRREGILRLKRLFIGRVRNSLRASVTGDRKKRRSEIAYLKEQLHRTEMDQLLRDYPIRRLHGKNLVLCYVMKKRWARVFYLMCRLVKGRR